MGGWSRLASAAAAVSLLAALGLPARAQTPADPKIDLKLFSKAEADLGSGCSVALWQSNRDPERDAYAYSFIERLDAKGVRQPARMKIGSEVVSLRRVAVGGKSSGYGLHEYQLYKLGQDSAYAVLELKLGPIEGEAVEIESGALTLSIPGKLPFRIAVKGGAGCMGGAEPAPPARGAATPEPAAGAAGRYALKSAAIPAKILKTAESKFGCQPALMTSASLAYPLSEEAALWQIACERFAYQASSVFALVYVPDPASQHTFLSFTGPKGRTRPTDPQVLMNPVWNAKTRTLTGISLGRAAGDCGVLERYRLVDSAFVLAEYREKEKCDGASMKPEQFPEIYRAK